MKDEFNDRATVAAKREGNGKETEKRKGKYPFAANGLQDYVKRAKLLLFAFFDSIFLTILFCR